MYLFCSLNFRPLGMPLICCVRQSVIVLYLCLSVSLPQPLPDSVCLSVVLPLPLTISFCRFLSHYFFPSLPVYLSPLFLRVSVCLSSLFLPVFVCLHPLLSLPLLVSICLSLSPPVCLPVSLPNLFLSLSICPYLPCLYLSISVPVSPYLRLSASLPSLTVSSCVSVSLPISLPFLSLSFPVSVCMSPSFLSLSLSVSPHSLLVSSCLSPLSFPVSVCLSFSPFHLPLSLTAPSSLAHLIKVRPTPLCPSGQSSKQVSLFDTVDQVKSHLDTHTVHLILVRGR